jgi:hypothetical protein
MKRANGPVACTLYRTRDGLELRAGVEAEAAVWTARVDSHSHALDVANKWKAAIVADGGAMKSIPIGILPQFPN